MESETVQCGELRQNITDFISRVRYERKRFVVYRHNRPVAALVSVEDFELLEKLRKEKKLKTT